jgi:hypothetical protein
MESQEALKLRITATRNAILFLNEQILEPNSAHVQQISTLWNQYPPRLDVLRNANKMPSFEEVLDEVKSKRKDLDLEMFVQKMMTEE